MKARLDYISRQRKIEIENDRGEVFRGKDEVKELFNDWQHEFGNSKPSGARISATPCT
ncbi:MAG TPA: hypothetical protein VGE12_22135 [Noviherbaspirillum sp.]